MNEFDVLAQQTNANIRLTEDMRHVQWVVAVFCFNIHNAVPE